MPPIPRRETLAEILRTDHASTYISTSFCETGSIRGEEIRCGKHRRIEDLFSTPRRFIEEYDPDGTRIWNLGETDGNPGKHVSYSFASR